MKKLLVAVAVAGLVGTANAQSAFEGAYGQIGVGYQSTKMKWDPSDGASINSSTGFASTIGVGYNFQIDKSFLLGLGAEYSPIASSQANVTFSDGTDKYKNQNTYNIFLSPSYVISKDSLAYAKVGYTGTTIKYSPFDGGSTNYNLNGYSLGLGYKQVIDGGLYGFAETNYLSYNNKTVEGGSKISANSMNFLVGIGYKF